MAEQKKPDCRILPVPGGGYYGIWRITGAWHRVKDGNGQPFASAYDALEAAKKRLHGVLFPDMKVDRLDPLEPGLMDEVAEFMARKQQEQADIGKQAFRQIFAKGKGKSTRAVDVEVRGKRKVRP